MPKTFHEIRDPIHVFIKMDSHERRVLDSRPFQRLRSIHQLALTYLVYPGASHKRFEHSLGVMELAGRVFDVLTADSASEEVKKHLPELADPDGLRYWRKVLRMAALCHDIGHLPFSHAAEKELLPEGWDHEQMTRELILCKEMREIWENLTPPLRPEHIVKLALGPKKAADFEFSDWEAILSEIIIGDAFGVDRMDYLLRDSYHSGVAYGKFDHYRLIDSLRILPSPPSSEKEERSLEPTLGVDAGGLHTAEALLLARYFMFTQVYFHPVRRIYDIHLKDYLQDWLPDGRFSTDVDSHMKLTDNEVISALRKAANDSSEDGHEHARRIIDRGHFKVLYERNPEDIAVNRNAAQAIFEAVKTQYGPERARMDSYKQKGGSPNFPVLTRDGRIVSSLAESQVLEKLPVAAFDYVFIDAGLRSDAEKWLLENRKKVIALKGEVE